MAYRDGWKGSEIFLVDLDWEFKPVGKAKQLRLRHRDANYGREDPRLFRFNGRLHLSFIGVVGDRHIVHTNQLYCRLSDRYEVEEIFHPQLPHRMSWEKNHQYFEHGDRLYAIYVIDPHYVLQIEGGRAERAYSTPSICEWTGGLRRGGASPVLVGDEFYSFFHGRVNIEGVPTYTLGVYCFEARPPFRVTRMTRDPLMTGDISTKPDDQWASVVFPCGAVRRADDWVVSMGIHDRWTELHSFSYERIEEALL